MATYAPTNYADCLADEAALAEAMKGVSVSITTAIARLAAAPATLDQIAQPAPVGYLSLIDFVNAQVIAEPANQNWLDMQSRLGEVVTNFGEKAIYLVTLNNAIAAIPPA